MAQTELGQEKIERGREFKKKRKRKKRGQERGPGASQETKRLVPPDGHQNLGDFWSSCFHLLNARNIDLCCIHSLVQR